MATANSSDMKRRFRQWRFPALFISSILLSAWLLLNNVDELKNRTQILQQTVKVIANQAELREVLSLSLSQSQVNLDRFNHLHLDNQRFLSVIEASLPSNPQLSKRFAALKQSFEEQFHLINAFKSSNAVFQNSALYFPTLIQDCSSKNPSAAVSDIIKQVYILGINNISHPSSLNQLKFQQAMDKLAKSTDQCNDLFKHGKILNEYLLKRHYQYQNILNAPIKGKLLEFYDGYEHYSQQNVQQSQEFNYLMLAINLLFMIYILWVLNKLSKQNHQLILASQELEKQRNLYHGLSEANQAIAKLNNAQEIFQAIVDIIHERVKVPSCMISQPTENGMIKALAVSGVGKDLLKHIPISVDANHPAGQGSISLAYRTQQPIIIHDYLNSKQAQYWLSQAKAFNLQSVASLPLFEQGKIYGIITLYSDQNHAFTEEVLEVISTFSNDLSLAIERLSLAQRQKNQEADLAVSAIAFESQENIIITDAQGIILKANQSFYDTTGFTPEEVIGQSPRIVKSGLEAPKTYQDIWQSLLATGHWHGEIRNRKKDGTIYPVYQQINAVYDKHHRVSNYISHAQDLTKQKQDAAKISFLQNHDELTGLANHPLLIERITQQLDQTSSYYNFLSLINLKRFKSINESLGHEAGDKLLIQVGRRLTLLGLEHVVEQTFARIGSDEFAILCLTEAQTHEALQTVSNQIIYEIEEAFKTPFQVENNSLNVEVAIGATVFSAGQKEQPIDIYQQALTALHRAKLNPTSHIQFFAEEMQSIAQEEFALEAALRSAFNNKEFVMYYQPQVDTQTGAYLGSEALIRWLTPNNELIPPYKFIPLLERTRLIIKVGYWLLEEVLNQTQQLPDFAKQSYTVSVNLSGVQFGDKQLVQTIKEILLVTQFPAQRLMLEVTESSLMADMQSGLAILHELKNLGCKIAIDDFGTGYSSFAYLKNMPVDELKIDKFFIDDIHNAKDSAIIQTIIALASALNIASIAEGVEDSSQLITLQTMDCDKIQGYYFSKPLPFEQLADFITHNPSTS